jgi:hypothetical protein
MEDEVTSTNEHEECFTCFNETNKQLYCSTKYGIFWKLDP